MRLDVVFHKGSNNKPAVIFIHGLGMDRDIWVNPSSSCILGGRFPIKSLLGKRPSAKDFGLFRDMPGENVLEFSTGEQPGDIQTLFDDLRFKGYTVITWSQKRPSGTIDSAVKELHEIVIAVHKMTEAGIILVGHSRGGLIGRRYLMRKDRLIRGLITISTPHKGSSIARVASYLSPLVSVINPLFSGGDEGTLSFTIKRIFDFLKSRALKELLPESRFIKSLKDGPLEWVHYTSVGGTNPTLFSIFNISFPDVFEKIIPENLYPEDIKKGKGDGLVSAASSRIPWCHEHYNFELNHAEILFDKGVRDKLVEAIDRIYS
jgi:pimeloyl-ACP methyl ester carboxylesterase